MAAARSGGTPPSGTKRTQRLRRSACGAVQRRGLTPPLPLLELADVGRFLQQSGGGGIEDTSRWLVLHGDERERAVVEARHAGVGAGLTQVPAGAPHTNGPPLAGAMVLYNWREKAEGRL